MITIKRTFNPSQGLLQVDDLRGEVFTGESGAHIFEISGVGVQLAGTVKGTFLAPNGVTIPLDGSAADGVVSMTLTEDCYVAPGRFILSIFLSSGSVTGCIYCGVGNVFRTQSDVISYPSASIPDIEQIIANAQAAAAQIQAEVTAAQAAVAAAQTAVDGIEDQRQTMIESIASVAGQGTDTTLTQSGVAADAKAAGDQISDLKSALSDTQDWIGFARNLFNARLFAITNTTNWTINSKTQTSISVTHNNQWTTGAPDCQINLPVGEYVFNADFSESALKSCSLRKNGSYFALLTDGSTFEIENGSTYSILFAPQEVGTYTITQMSIKSLTLNGIIQEVQSDIDDLSESITNANANISDLQSGFADIAELDINSLVGTETQSVAINASGTVYTAGSPNFRLVKYDVTAGKKYWITANANWGNLLWCFYDTSDAVVALGQASASGSDDTIITNTEITAPAGASYILVAFNYTTAPADCKTQTGYVLKGKWTGKKWVCVGDSLTAENIRTTKHYFDYVADETGITTVNMGDSGSGYAREQDVGTAFYQRISDCPTDADVVTIFGSFNDLGAGLPIGSVDDTGTTTLAGCINTTITNLQTAIPLVNLGIVAPTPWDTTQPSTSGQAYNYVTMLKDICERRSIPFLDLWRESNLRPWDADFRTLAYSKDGGSGTHPDENGHKLIAPRFKGFLETLLM